MPRAKRVEYAGAIYHVINRGNYRQELFSTNEWKTAASFEKTLLQCAQRSNWKLHAWVVMNNHYHICVQTLLPNLSQGMQWLQSVFANRFNHFTQTPGHVFQGRYKAILVEPQKRYLELINYIHLNPVRAGVVGVKELNQYQWSSFPRFLNGQSTDVLESSKWLSIAGFQADTEGMEHYWKYLASREEGEATLSEQLDQKLCRGWCLGSEAFKQELIGSIPTEKFLQRGGKEQTSLVEALWEKELKNGLKLLDKSKLHIEKDAKSARWKCLLGLYMKSRFGVNNRYLSENLSMGSLSYLSHQIKLLSETDLKNDYEWKLLTENKQA